jgi:hypothetical protein
MRRATPPVSLGRRVGYKLGQPGREPNFLKLSAASHAHSAATRRRMPPRALSGRARRAHSTVRRRECPLACLSSLHTIPEFPLYKAPHNIVDILEFLVEDASD